MNRLNAIILLILLLVSCEENLPTVEHDNIHDSEASGYVPNAPSKLKYREFDSTKIILTWEDNSTGELGFKIAQSVEIPKNYTIIDSVGRDIKEIEYKSKFEPSTNYFFLVFAFNANGNSEYSNSVVVKYSR